MKKPTVTLAISALNEEKNIKAFLRSVLMQAEEGYALKSIWIYSDGSTDKTVKFAKEFKDKRIVVFSDDVRRGKTHRLNTIYKNLKSDFLVQSDADVTFSHPYIIKDMIKPLIDNKKVMMCGGNPQPLKAVTFTEKAVNCTVQAFIPLRESIRGGNNVFSADGRLLAYRKEFVKKLFIPEVDIIANDAYTYYACKTFKHEYKFVQTAVVNFRSPQNITDQIRQNTRFLAMPMKMSKYFDQELVRYERSIPRYMLGVLMLRVFLTHPILCSYIYTINIYCKLLARKNGMALTSMWQMAYSTKKLNTESPLL